MIEAGRNRIGRTLLFGALIVLAGGCVRTLEDVRSEQVLEVRAPTNYLECAQPALTARADTQVIGPAGGVLRVGNSSITIPANAFTDQQRVVFALARGDSVGVEISVGRPYDFNGNRSAPIMISTEHCTDAQLQGPWFVWRINRQDVSGSQKLMTMFAGQRAIVHVDSISSFMIAN